MKDDINLKEVLGKGDPEENVSFVENRDEATLISVSRKIRTLAQLLAYSETDQDVWEVKEHKVQVWDMGRSDKRQDLKWDKNQMDGWAKDSGKVFVQPLYKIAATLQRKTSAKRGMEEILKRIEAGSPVLPKIKRPKQPKSTPKRTLELCIMDPHIGLLCNYPEADGPWDLETAAGCIMQAIDDLIEKASVFGPFDEVVMPFGNDFVHCDTVFHETTAGTGQPEAMSWHQVYTFAAGVAIEMVERVRLVAPVKIYEIPGNHSRMADFTMALMLKARFHHCKDVTVDASSSPYKFHRCGVNLIGYEHGHSVSAIRLAALMANERRKDWSETEYREFHLGDQHRKGSSKPSMLEEQGVSIEYIPGLTAPNEWHRLKSFSHQKRGAMAFVWDWKTGPIARFQFNLSQYHHGALK